MPRLSSRTRLPGLALAWLCFLAGCDRAVYSCADCNVVLISVDTLRADHVGAYGYARATTPNIDALAARGVVFENAISQSSWTRPAHMSMMTGLYPSEHGYVGLSDRGRLPDSVPTLARELTASGRRSIAFTGGINVSRVYGFDQGFDEFRSNGKVFRDDLEETRYWLDLHATERFFLFWHGYDAHTPYANESIDRQALGIAPRRPRIRVKRICRKGRKPAVAKLVAEYDGSIHHADRYVGKLVAELERRDLMRKTIIVVTSDHGEEFREHRGCFHINTLYREVLWVPLIVVAPGLPPLRIPDLVPASVAIGPTILAMAGVGKHALPGPSLAPALTGRALPVEGVVSETRRRAPKGKGEVRSLTTPDHKLIRWITQGRDEAFDLRSDPGERSPRSDGDELHRLRETLAAWEKVHASKQPARTASEHSELEGELRGLGYLE